MLKVWEEKAVTCEVGLAGVQLENLVEPRKEREMRSNQVCVGT